MPTAAKRAYAVGDEVWANTPLVFSKQEGDEMFEAGWKTTALKGVVVSLEPRRYLVEFNWTEYTKVVSLHGKSLWRDKELAELDEVASEEDDMDSGNELEDETDEDVPATPGPLTPQDLGNGYSWNISEVTVDKSKPLDDFVGKLNWSRANPPPGMVTWNALGAKTPLEALHEFMLRGISDKLLGFWEQSGLKNLTERDMYIFFGALLKCTDLAGGDRRDAWFEPDAAEGENLMFEPVFFDLGRFIPCKTFEKMYRGGLGVRIETQLWKNSADMLRVVSDSCQRFISPPKYIILDESKAVSYGDEQQRHLYEKGIYQEGKMPPLDYDAKPRPGWWHFCLATKLGRFPFVLGLEARACPQPDFPGTPQTLGKSARAVIRAVHKYFGTNRVVVMDGHYTSAPLSAYLGSQGLCSIGALKTCHRFFPKQELGRFASTLPRGDHCSLVCTTQGVQLIGVGYSNKKASCFLAGNCSTTGKGPRRGLRRWKPDQGTYYKEFDVPQVVHEYWNYMNAVDVFDRLQQDVLGLWKHFRTACFHRRMLIFILGVVFTNAYSAYSFDSCGRRGAQNPSVAEFKRILIAQCLSLQSVAPKVHETSPRELRSGKTMKQS
jgi:hypothetical protein